MRHIPLNEQDWSALYQAQLASFERGDLYLAGTRLLTSEHAWHLADGRVVRDDSGEEEKFFASRANQHGNQLL